MTIADGEVARRGAVASGRTAWRLAAIVLFLGLPLAAAGLTGLAVTAGLDASQVADHAEDTARAIVHQLDHRSPVREAPVDTAARYLASPSAGLARAELQAMAGRLVEAGGGRVIELQSTDPSEPDPANHVSVDATFDVTNAGLLDILFETETGLPLLSVPRLEARTELTTEEQAGAGQLLRVTMTLRGTWKGAAP